MKNRYLVGWLLFFLPFLPLLAAHAQTNDNTYETPERLFYIGKSANRNIVCYDVNAKNGQLDTENPIKVYWVNREEHPGRTNGLSYFQRKMAYGYDVVSKGNNTCRCTLTAYPHRQLTIMKHRSKYTCLININHQAAILKSLYVKSKPHNPLSVEYVVLEGIDLKTHKVVKETIKK